MIKQNAQYKKHWYLLVLSIRIIIIQETGNGGPVSLCNFPTENATKVE